MTRRVTKRTTLRATFGGSVGSMTDAVPERQVATALCNSCGRIVEGRQLRRAEWKGKKGKEHDYVCYACRYNVFPPGHPLFDRVQKWRAERGFSIVQATAERIAKFKGQTKVEDAKATVQVTSVLMKANDERMLESAREAWKTGLVSYSLMGSRCNGPGCQNVITGPVVVTQPESKKRKAVWGYCSQKCVDDFHAFLIKDIRHKPVLIPKFSAGGQVVAYLRRDTGDWVKPGDLGEVEFCPRCDRPEDLCSCTKAQLDAFHKAARRGDGEGGPRYSPPTNESTVGTFAAVESVALPEGLGSENGHGARGEPATLPPVPLPIQGAGASSHETPVANPEASEIQKLAGREAKKLHKKLGEQASAEMEGLQ